MASPSWRSTGQRGWKDKARESSLVTEPLLREGRWELAPFQPAEVQVNGLLQERRGGEVGISTGPSPAWGFIRALKLQL